MAYSTNNRISGGSFLSDEELVVIRLGGSAALEESQPARPVTLSSQPTLTSKLSSYNSVDYLTQSPTKPQIQRFAMRKKRDQQKTPLIIATQSTESYPEEEEEGGQDNAEKGQQNLLLLSRTDLPRNMRSTRRLSACNEQLIEQLAANLASSNQNNNPKCNTLMVDSCQKAASCDAISSPPLFSKKPGENGVNKKSVHSMPSLNNDKNSDSPIWGQFHFFPNASVSVGTQLEMEARRYMMSGGANAASFTTIGTNATYLYTSAFEPPTTEPTIVLMPSSYDLNKDDPQEEKCFTVLLLSGFAVLIITVSASVGMVFGFF